MYQINQAKYDESIKILQLASKMSEQYYQKPLLLTYSGGKDSDVLLHLALESGIKFEIVNNHTTVDAPETVYHIREVFKELREQGINAYIRYSGTTMWKLIEYNMTPPTLHMRYCCVQLKESKTPNRFVALGVRREESTKRANRPAFETRKSKTMYISKSLEETEEVYQDAQTHDAVWDCKFIELAKQNQDLICNPIYAWTNGDVWSYIRNRGIKYNVLYDRGFTRVGCIGCPLATTRERERQFAIYPKYKENYLKAFDRMLKRREEKGKKSDKWSTPEDVFDWWMGYDRDPDRLEGQISFDDMEDGDV